jgi:D-sedoheptulose 7-phosphate isomerase
MIQPSRVYFTGLLATLKEVMNGDQLDPLFKFILECPGTLWVAGNGGSMANALHWATDLTKAGHKTCRALGSNPAMGSAYANDEGYQNIFLAELAGSARVGDRLLVFSCSGESSNILLALDKAWPMGMEAAAIIGMKSAREIKLSLQTRLKALVVVPSLDYGVIEDVTMAIGHWVTEALKHTGQEDLR